MQKYLQDQTINKITTFLHNNQNNQTVQLLFAQYLQEIIIADYEQSLPLQELFSQAILLVSCQHWTTLINDNVVNNDLVDDDGWVDRKQMETQDSHSHVIMS